MKKNLVYFFYRGTALFFSIRLKSPFSSFSSHTQNP